MSAESITAAELRHRAVTLRLSAEKCREQQSVSTTLGGRKGARLRAEAFDARAEKYERLVGLLATLEALPRGKR